MPDASQPILQDLKDERCPRCLQPLPVKASRCPGCGQPIHSSLRFVPIAIGIAGLLALVFAMVVMYQVVANEDAANAPAPVDANTPQQQQLFPDAPAADSTNQPAKPDKAPPLNEH